ncbi:hypothetical protein [Orrella sp. 11846]|uniref:hypothetical protein n=1 Tax=Orrella sp. 11846 TaxID=3409913 RepID=UPI003B59357B
MRSIVFVLMLMIGYISNGFAAQVVVLSNDTPPREIGQGFLTAYGNQCLLIMPTHVAQEGGVNFRREGRVSIFGSVSNGHDLGDDVSLFSVRGVNIGQCGSSMSILPRAVDNKLRNARAVQTRFINGDGTIGQMAVVVVDNDQAEYLRIKPLIEGEQIFKGLSGSLLTVEGDAIGMLLSVHARSGVGTVIRQDTLLKKAEQFLRQIGNVVKENEDVDQQQSSLKLIAWDSLPIKSTTSDSESKDLSTSTMRFAYAGKPVSLDYELLTKGNALSGIRIDARGIPEEERPKILELMASSNATSPSWNSVKTQRLEFVDGVATMMIAPRRAKLLRLKLSHATTSGATSTPDVYLGVNDIQTLP